MTAKQATQNQSPSGSTGHWQKLLGCLATHICGQWETKLRHQSFIWPRPRADVNTSRDIFSASAAVVTSVAGGRLIASILRRVFGDRSGVRLRKRTPRRVTI